MAASFSEIRIAIKTTLEAAIPSLTVYPTVEAVNVLPAAVVYPDELDYLETFRQGFVAPYLDLYVLCSAADWGVGQDGLDAYVDPFGESSIARALLDNEGAIGLAGVQCVPRRMSRYGGSFESCGIPHVGATIQLQIVMNRGT